MQITYYWKLWSAQRQTIGLFVRAFLSDAAHLQATGRITQTNKPRVNGELEYYKLTAMRYKVATRLRTAKR